MRYQIKKRWLVVGACLVLSVFWWLRDPNRRFSQIGEYVAAIAFSPDGRTIAISYENFILRTVDPQTGLILRQFKGKLPAEPDRFTSVTFSPDGKTLACGLAGRFGDAINTWDAATGKWKWLLTGSAQSVAFSPNGQLLAGGGAEWKPTPKLESWTLAIPLWDVKTGKLKQTLRHPIAGNIRAIAFAPDGKSLILENDLEDPKNRMMTHGAMVSVWNTKSGKVMWSRRESELFTFAVAFSPDGQTVANLELTQVSLRYAQTGKSLHTLKMPDGSMLQPYCLAFSPDGAILAVGATITKTLGLNNFSTTESITLWNGRTGAFLKMLNNHIGRVRAVAYSPNGKLLASGSEDHTVCFWDTKTWTVTSSTGMQVEYPHSPWS